MGLVRTTGDPGNANRMWFWRSDEVQSNDARTAEKALARCGVRGQEHSPTASPCGGCSSTDYCHRTWQQAEMQRQPDGLPLLKAQRNEEGQRLPNGGYGQSSRHPWHQTRRLRWTGASPGKWII